MAKNAVKFHEMKNDELDLELKELKEKLFRLRFSHATGQLSNPQEMVLCKKDIARVKTIINERVLKAAAKGEKLVIITKTPLKKPVADKKATVAKVDKKVEKAVKKPAPIKEGAVAAEEV